MMPFFISSPIRRVTGIDKPLGQGADGNHVFDFDGGRCHVSAMSTPFWPCGRLTYTYCISCCFTLAVFEAQGNFAVLGVDVEHFELLLFVELEDLLGVDASSSLISDDVDQGFDAWAKLNEGAKWRNAGNLTFDDVALLEGFDFARAMGLRCICLRLRLRRSLSIAMILALTVSPTLT